MNYLAMIVNSDAQTLPLV